MAEWYQPDASPLSKKEEEAAYEGQINYPKVIRQRKDPPIVNQTHSLLSFLFLPESHNGVFAFVKCRGVYGDKTSADDAGKKIIRDVDSKFKINIAPVGQWVPITDDSRFCAEDVDVKMNEDDPDEIQLNDDAVKETERRHEKIRKDLQDRAKKLLDPNDDPYADEEGIKYYIMRRVTRACAKQYIEEEEKKKQDLIKKLESIEEIIAGIEEKFPSYKEEWLTVYNKGRKDVGLPPVKSEDEIGK